MGVLGELFGIIANQVKMSVLSAAATSSDPSVRKNYEKYSLQQSLLGKKQKIKANKTMIENLHNAIKSGNLSREELNDSNYKIQQLYRDNEKLEDDIQYIYDEMDRLG